jgi:hypothetical protein
MKHLPKDVQKLKDSELVERLFPKEVIKKLKADLAKEEKRKPKSK